MKPISLFVVAVCSIFLISEKAVADLVSDLVTLENETGKTITELYASDHNSRVWGENLLGTGEPMPTGTRFTFRLYDIDSRHWDLKAVFADGTSDVWRDGFPAKSETVILDGQFVAHTK